MSKLAHAAKLLHLPVNSIAEVEHAMQTWFVVRALLYRQTNV